MKHVWLLLGLCPLSAAAATLEVGAGQTYSTIADALGDAAAGDLIRVHAPHAETDSFDMDGRSFQVEGVGDAADIVLTTNSDDGFFKLRNSSVVEVTGVTLDGNSDRRILKIESNSSFTLRDSVVRDGQHNDGPSMEVKSGASATVEDTSFSSGRGARSGHIYVREGATLVVRRSTFDDGQATENGGAILCRDGGDCTVEDSTFTNNVATLEGGAIHCREGASCVITGSTFTGNQATQSGGAIRIDSTTVASVADNRIHGNQSGLWGGGVYLTSASGEFLRNAVCDNTSTDDGGGFYSRYSGSIYVFNNVFANNSGGDRAGGIRNRDGTGTWGHNAFLGNTASGEGHAFDVSASTTTTAHDLIVQNPTTNGTGGTYAVHIDASTFTGRYLFFWDNANTNANITADGTWIVDVEAPDLQPQPQGCELTLAAPAWQGNLVDAGSSATLELDLDGSPADIGPFGGPDAPAWAWEDTDQDDVIALWDCDDDDPAVAPDAAEICDGKDNDCDGELDEGITVKPSWYEDVDGDGFGDADTETVSCAKPDGVWVDNDRDCDDTRDDVHPGEVEQCDDVDHDCDGTPDNGIATSTWYADVDDDGFGSDTVTVEDCAEPFGYVDQGGDCDDAEPSINPDATEIDDNDVDEDCDGVKGTSGTDTDPPDTDTDPPDTDTDPTDTDTDPVDSGDLGDTALPDASDRDVPEGLVGSDDLDGPAQAGCGCSSGGPSGAGLWALGLLALARRRRR